MLKSIFNFDYFFGIKSKDSIKTLQNEQALIIEKYRCVVNEFKQSPGKPSSFPKPTISQLPFTISRRSKKLVNTINTLNIHETNNDDMVEKTINIEENIKKKSDYDIINNYINKIDIVEETADKIKLINKLFTFIAKNNKLDIRLKKICCKKCIEFARSNEYWFTEQFKQINGYDLKTTVQLFDIIDEYCIPSVCYGEGKGLDFIVAHKNILENYPNYKDKLKTQMIKDANNPQFYFSKEYQTLFEQTLESALKQEK